VEIFQNQDECSLAAQNFDSFTDLSKHPVATSREHVSVKSYLLVFVQERWKVDEPSGGVTNQRRYDTLITSCQLSHGF
jgi:hypothetical protein